MASFPVPDEYKIVRHVQSVRTYVTELDQSNTPNVRQAGEECVMNGTWSSIVHVLALSSVLSEPIVSVFPDVPHYARSLYHCVIQPQSTSQHLNVSGFRPLINFWSQYGNPSKAADLPYTPNHVVPLVPSEEGELVVTSPSGPSTQDVERSPQLVVTSPNGPSTQDVERSPQFVVTTPSGPNTEGEIIAATIQHNKL